MISIYVDLVAYSFLTNLIEVFPLLLVLHAYAVRNIFAAASEWLC